MESVFCLCKKIVQVLYVSRNEIASEVMSICLLCDWVKEGKGSLTLEQCFDLAQLPGFYRVLGQCLGAFGVKGNNYDVVWWQKI